MAKPNTTQRTGHVRSKPLSRAECSMLLRRMPTPLVERVHKVADHEGRHLNRIVRDLLEVWVAEKEGSIGIAAKA